MESWARILAYLDVISEELLHGKFKVIETNKCFLIHFDIPISIFSPEIMKSGPDAGLVSCVKKGWIFPSYNHYNWSKISIATSFKKGILSVLKKRMLVAKTSFVFHYMNIGKI